MGQEILLLQNTLPAAASTTSILEQYPIAIRSISTVLPHVSLGLPFFRFLSAAHVRAVRGKELLSIRSTCPIHVHLLRHNLLAVSFYVSSLAHLFI